MLVVSYEEYEMKVEILYIAKAFELVDVDGTEMLMLLGVLWQEIKTGDEFLFIEGLETYEKYLQLRSDKDQSIDLNYLQDEIGCIEKKTAKKLSIGKFMGKDKFVDMWSPHGVLGIYCDAPQKYKLPYSDFELRVEKNKIRDELVIYRLVNNISIMTMPK